MAHVSLQDPGRRLLGLVLGFVLLGAGALGIVRWFLVARAHETPDRASLQRALRLAPDDALLHYRLARWEQFSLEEADLARAVRRYRRAAELNPHESVYWLDLADALLVQGDAAAGARAVERALAVDPRTPRTLWRAGNFYLRAGNSSRAFSYFHRALVVDPRLAPLVIQTAHRLLDDPDRVVRDVLPLQPRFLLAYLRRLVAVPDVVAARRVWRALLELRRPFKVERALFYLDFLIKRRQVDEAVDAWRALERRGLLPAGSAGDGNRLYNAGLHQPVLDGGFGWQVIPAPHVHVNRGEGRPAGGAPAVVIRFAGEENLHYRHFFQYVPVEPGRRYRLQAWLRAEDITTESSVRLELAEIAVPDAKVARSPGVVGTTGWVREQVELATGPDTRLLRAGLVRLPSRRVSNAVRGTVRASEFSLQPALSAE